MDTYLNVENLGVGIAGKELLTGISFKVVAGDTTVIIGPNGSGKTLLIKTLLGLLPQTDGKYSWRPKTKIGYVPQKFAIDKNVPITVAEFLALKCKSPTDVILKTIQAVGLPDKVMSWPMRTLSGGQFQRVIVAWSIIDDPDVLIFDEPTESIDVAGQACVYEIIDSLKLTKQIAVILITHDLDVVYSHANKVVCLKGGTMVVSSDSHELIDKHLLETVYGLSTHHYHGA